MERDLEVKTTLHELELENVTLISTPVVTQGQAMADTSGQGCC